MCIGELIVSTTMLCGDGLGKNNCRVMKLISKKAVILTTLLIAVSMASCLTSSKPINSNISVADDIETIDNLSEPEISEINPATDQTMQEYNPEGPAISIRKEIIDSNNNGQLDDGEKVKIIYGASDPDGVTGIKLKVDGFGIENRNRAGTYYFITDPLSSGTHGIKVLAMDSLGNQNSQKISFFVNGTGPSIFFPAQKFTKKEGETFNIILSATNPVGNPPMNVQLTIKTLSTEIQIYEAIFCKSVAGMCTGAFDVDAGGTREVSISMKAGKPGKYKISGDVSYRFEGDNSSKVPTNYLLTVIVE